MRTYFSPFFIRLVMALSGLFTRGLPVFAQSPAVGQIKHLIFHDIRVDKAGFILPWYADDPATSYNFILHADWNYWKYIPGHWARKAAHNDRFPDWRKELPFPPKYMIFRTLEDLGVGGDQFAQLLSSFNLYYDYTGDEDVLNNMVFQAEWYLKYGLSDGQDAWPNLPYPCNMTEAPIYDGDLILGKGVTQPDKAGNFAAELIMLYKKTGNARFLDAAIQIANTLAKHTRPGDYDHSPLPFKVEAKSGEVRDSYSTDWSGTLQLFRELTQLGQGNMADYGKACKLIDDWMLQFPVKNNRWGPFFEDIKVWSDTEINEGMFAWYMLTHKELYPNWKIDVRNMQDWALSTLGIEYWKYLGCTVMGEQSVYKMQGQSHTARHASVELLYAALTGDHSRQQEAIRQLNFCTYAVDNDGKCRWMNFDTYEIWWSDGYGDFIRHFLRAMAADPELAPGFEDHILSSSSVLQKVDYAGRNGKSTKTGVLIRYTAFGDSGRETIRMTKKPAGVIIGDKSVAETKKDGSQQGFVWQPLDKGGLLIVNRAGGNTVEVLQ